MIHDRRQNNTFLQTECMLEVFVANTFRMRNNIMKYFN